MVPKFFYIKTRILHVLIFCSYKSFFYYPYSYYFTRLLKFQTSFSVNTINLIIFSLETKKLLWIKTLCSITQYAKLAQNCSSENQNFVQSTNTIVLLNLLLRLNCSLWTGLKKKTTTLWPLFMDGVQLPQGCL